MNAMDLAPIVRAAGGLSAVQRARYSRQILLNGFGEEAQLRLLASRVSRPTMSLVTWCVRHHPEIAAGGVPYNLRRVTELAAELQNRTIADVVTAIPMTRAQEDRLRAILAWRIGTDVELNTTIDPSVIGGVKVSVRDLVMDSTVRSTVAGLRVRLTG